MDLELRRFASALALALCSSSCFSPQGNGSASDPSSDAGSSTELTGGDTLPPTGSSSSSSSTGGDSGDSGDAPTGGDTHEPDTDAVTTGAEHCGDGQQSGDETDVDCGGSCEPCEGGLGCAADGDCASMACLDEACVADPECLQASDCAAAVCNQASCVGFACVTEPQPRGAGCDDGLVCTRDESCAAGMCTASSPKPIALADVPQFPELGLFFDGTTQADLAGGKLGDAGDFNGDGVKDLFVVGTKRTPRVYVLFGGPELATRTLADAALGVGGLVIEVDVGGALSVAGAGDVDGDGLDDLLIGTPQNVKTGLTGGAYVVRGRAETAAIKLASKPADVYLITGPSSMVFTGFGTAVAGLGDIDGDARVDFVVTAPQYVGVNAENVGAAFVVYGSNMLGDGKIEDYVGNGRAYRVEGPAGEQGFGASVAGVGDFNGDGRRDLAVGQPSWGKGKGRAWVIYTPLAPGSVKLGATPEPMEGLAMSGTTMNLDKVGGVVAGAGDFNGDGAADVVVSGSVNLRRVMIVYGGKYGGEITASTLAKDNHGSLITTLTELGPAVAGGLDVNGDLIDDVVIGAPGVGTDGTVFVAFGAKGQAFTRTVVELAAGKGGYTIAGPAMLSQTGAAVALVPSVDGDERAEVFLGAPSYDVKPGGNEGRAYLVFGGDCEG